MTGFRKHTATAYADSASREEQLPSGSGDGAALDDSFGLYRDRFRPVSAFQSSKISRLVRGTPPNFACSSVQKTCNISETGQDRTKLTI